LRARGQAWSSLRIKTSRREHQSSKVHHSSNFGRKRAPHNCVLVSSRTSHPASACASPPDSAAARLISDASQSSSSQSFV
jgi:hypothetical protein